MFERRIDAPCFFFLLSSYRAPGAVRERYCKSPALEHPPFLQRLNFFLRGVHRYPRALGGERSRKDACLIEEEYPENLGPGGVAHECPQEVVGHMSEFYSFAVD